MFGIDKVGFSFLEKQYHMSTPLTTAGRAALPYVHVRVSLSRE